MESATMSSAALPRDCWYAMALSSAIGHQPMSIPFEDGELVASRNSAGTVVVRRARCAHRGCSLSGGWIQDGHLTCPYHGWQYDDQGQCRHIPALRAEESIPAQARVASYPALEANGMVWVWIPGEHKQPTYAVEPIPEIERTEMVHQPDADLSYVFQTHYTRGIENGIDPTHAHTGACAAPPLPAGAGGAIPWIYLPRPHGQDDSEGRAAASAAGWV